MDQSAERVAQPTRLQALFEGAALGAPHLGGEGHTAEQPASARSQDEHAWARDYDLFGPGPATVEEYGDKKLVVDDFVQPSSVEARVTQLTNIVQELARLVASSVASPSAQPLEGAAPGAPAASSENPAYREKLKGTIPALRLSSGAAVGGSGPGPPGSPSSSSSSSSSSEDDDNPACRMCGSRKHHEKDWPIGVRIRVPQVVVRGVAGVAAVQALRGVPGKTLESAQQLPRRHQRRQRKRRLGLSP